MIPHTETLLPPLTTLQQCRICESRNIQFDKELSSQFSGKIHQFFLCRDCGTIMDSLNESLDYAGDGQWVASTGVTHSVQYYIEFGAGLLSMAAELKLLAALTPQSGSSKIRYLDVGTGFGFFVHMAHTLGWTAIGVEPSTPGRIGSEILGLQIKQEYLEDTDLPKQSFNLISSSEVIEHVQDPDRFISVLATYLAPKGILLLTTPNAVVLPGNGVEQEWLELYSAGAHLNIFSPRSVEIVLSRNGFNHTRIIPTDGSSGQKRLIVLAAREDGVLPDTCDLTNAKVEAKAFLKTYLRDMVAEREHCALQDHLYGGALYRLIEILVNDGNYEQASEYCIKADELIAAQDIDECGLLELKASSFADYLTQIPAYASCYYFLKGMIGLNYQKNYDEAVRYFKTSAHLSRIEEKIAPGYFINLGYGRAKVYEGLALLSGGKQREALQVFDSLLAEPEKVPSDLSRLISWSAGIAHFQMRENTAALRHLGKLALQEQSFISPEAQPPALHMLLAVSQILEDIQSRIDSVSNAANRIGDNTNIIANQLNSVNEVANGFNKIEQASALINQRLDKFDEVAHRIDSNIEEAVTLLNHRLDKVGKATNNLLQKANSIEPVLRQVADSFARLTKAVESVAAIVSLPLHVLRKFKKPHSYSISQDGSEQTIGELLAGRQVEQQIICTEDDFASIRLKIGTYQRVNTCSTEVAILDEGKTKVRSVMESASQYKDNQIRSFSFKPIADSKGKKFWINISSPDAVSGDAITVWHKRKSGQGFVLIDGRKVKGTLPYHLSYEKLREVSDVGAQDILIITPDRLGKIRIGLGMRHWEIAKALAARGLLVTLATPHDIASDLKGEGFSLHSSLSEEDALILAEDHRFVLVQGDVLRRYPSLESSKKQIIVDITTPIHIENLSKSQEEFEIGREVITTCLKRGDFFICGNERQRVYWLGMLTALGRIRSGGQDAELRDLVDVVGFGIPDEPPIKLERKLKGVFKGIQKDDFVLIWFGGLWDWLDPLTLIHAVHESHKSDQRIKLFFPAYRQVSGDVPPMAAKAKTLSVELGALNTSVFFNEYPIPYEERGDYLFDSDAGVICQAANFETQISARTRVLDYVWASLPILINPGDEWSEAVQRYDLGMVVSGGIDEWKQAILYLAENPEEKARKAANVTSIQRSCYWKQLVEPIFEFVMTHSSENSSRFALRTRN